MGLRLNIAGLMTATPYETRRPTGGTRDSPASVIAAAALVSLGALPAVMLPPSRNAGFSSNDVPSRLCSLVERCAVMGMYSSFVS
jgi:hypothetical protein